MTALKKMSDEELRQEFDRRNAVQAEDNAEYSKIRTLEHAAWGRYSASVFAVAAVSDEIDRRDRRLRKEMKPFHKFTRTQMGLGPPLLVTTCDCGWWESRQSEWSSGSGTSAYRCEQDLAGLEVTHLRDVKVSLNNQYTTNKGDKHGTGSGNQEDDTGDRGEAGEGAGDRQ